MNVMKFSVTLTLALTAAAMAPAPTYAVPVGLELALLVDVSSSVSATEFNLQKTGYVNAFSNTSLQNAIQAIGGIAVTYIQWSGSTQQQQSVGWTLINDPTSALAFASAIGAAPRPFSGGTAPASALDFAAPLFFNNGFEGQRSLIDFSTDGGGQTTGSETLAARNAALSSGITSINGIVISELDSVTNFYTNNAVGGQNAFLLQVDDFSEFQGGILQKLGRETECGGRDQLACAVPLPGSMPLMALGLVGLGAAIRRRFN